MKIGIFDPYLDDLGGGEKYIMSLAFCLSHDHDVSIFWDNKQNIKELERRFLFDLSKIRLAKNIFSTKVGFLERLLASQSYDAIIFLSDGSIPFVLSKKLFIHIQQPLSVSINSIKTKIKLSRVSAFFYNSKYTESFIDKLIIKKFFIIYPPVELYAKKIKKENMILHVGRFRVKNVGISDYKKQSIMIEEFKKMINNGLVNWRFVLAVSVKDKDKESFEALKNNAKDFPVDFIINKNNKELWEAYNKSKIYWHATGYGEDLQKNPEFAEHFGISTVEAMGGGAVPVVINTGGQKEIVQNRVNGFLWDTLEELQNRTLELIKNEQLWQEMSKKAIERANDFAGERFCKEITRMIEQ